MHTGVEAVNPWADGFHQRLRCLVVKPNEFFRHRLKNWRVEKTCRQRLQNQNPAEISRQCLENLINSLNKRFARRRLANRRNHGGVLMIANDRELDVTLGQIAHFQRQIAHLRNMETHPENYRGSVSGFFAEIDRMQLEVREYLSVHPAELERE